MKEIKDDDKYYYFWIGWAIGFACCLLFKILGIL